MQAAVVVEPSEVVGAEPASVEHRARPVRLPVVPVEEHRAAQQHLTGRIDLHRHPVQRVAVVDAAAAGLGHAVGRDDPDPARLGPQPAVRGQRATADEHGVERRERLDLLVVAERTDELGGHEGDVAARPGHRLEHPAGDPLVDDRLGVGPHRAEEQLHAGDVGRRQVEHPLPRAAEPGVRGVGGGAHRLPRQADPLRSPGRAAGLDHQRRRVVGGVPGTQQREDLARVPADRVQAAHRSIVV